MTGTERKEAMKKAATLVLSPDECAAVVADYNELISTMKDLVALLVAANITDNTGVIERARAAIKKSGG